MSFKLCCLIVLVTACFSNVSAQDKACLKKMRTGVFTYSMVDGSQISVLRTRTKQIETLNGGKGKLIMKIQWTSDSTYILTLKKYVNIKGCMKRGDKIWAEITTCSNTRYACVFKTLNCGSGSLEMVRKE